MSGCIRRKDVDVSLSAALRSSLCPMSPGLITDYSALDAAALPAGVPPGLGLEVPQHHRGAGPLPLRDPAHTQASGYLTSRALNIFRESFHNIFFV